MAPFFGNVRYGSSIGGSTSDIIETDELVVSVVQCLAHTPPTRAEASNTVGDRPCSMACRATNSPTELSGGSMQD